MADARAVRLDERVPGNRPTCPYGVAVEPTTDGDYQLVQFRHDGNSRDDVRVRPDRSLRDWADGPPSLTASADCELAIVPGESAAVGNTLKTRLLLIDVTTGETAELELIRSSEQPYELYSTVDGFVLAEPSPTGWNLVDLFSGEITASFPTGRRSGEHVDAVSAEGRTIAVIRDNQTPLPSSTRRVLRAGNTDPLFSMIGPFSPLGLSPSGNVVLHGNCDGVRGVPIDVDYSVPFGCMVVDDLRTGERWRFDVAEHFGTWNIVDDRTLEFCGRDVGRLDIVTRTIRSEPHPVRTNELDRQLFCSALQSMS